MFAADFGACALQNLFSAFVAVLLLFVIYLVVPALLTLTSIALAGLVFIKKGPKKTLAVAALVIDGLLIVGAAIFIAVSWAGMQ
ncbi:MAG: hypothetical protein QM785_01320 [Pyrinomonadaceae bacterium]